MDFNFIPNHTSTYSKAAHVHLPHYPQTVDHAYGCYVWASREREYKEKRFIDFTASLGAIIRGYYPINYSFAPSYPLPTQVEQYAAHILLSGVRGEYHKVRFAKNGSDITEASIRLARYHTKKELVICNSYHGSHSDLINATLGKSGGVLPTPSLLPVSSPDNIIALLTHHHSEIAAVLIEPLTPTCLDWKLEEISSLCTTHNVFLILDEMITGWRMKVGSSADTAPDLYCFGKAIGNGAPIAALVGREEIMNHLEKDVFMSFTAAGECYSLYALYDNLTLLETVDYKELRLWGEEVRSWLGSVVSGYSTRLTIQLNQEKHFQFISSLAQRGILVGRDFFMMFSHLDLPEHEQEYIKVSIQEAIKECSL